MTISIAGRLALVLALALGAHGCRASSRSAAAPTTAASTPATEMPEATVLAALSGREWTTADPTVVALDESAIPALLRIARDDGDVRPGYERVRALLALRHQRKPEVLEFLVAFLGEDHDAPRVRAALDSLSVGFGGSDRDRVLETC